MAMKKMILVYSASASKVAAVEDEVLTAVRQMQGWMVGKYKIRGGSFEENVAKLEVMLGDGDLLVVAGGDGTAALAVNAAMRSGKRVTLGVLGYGNFCDVAEMLRVKSLGDVVRKFEAEEVKDLWPLEVKINDELWRYAICYFSMGLMAEAAGIMDDPTIRAKISDNEKKATRFVLMRAVKWYLRNHRRQFLAAGDLNGEEFDAKATDYLAVNGPTLAKIMRGGEWWQNAEEFGSTLQQLGKFWKMVRFGMTSVKKGVPLSLTKRDLVVFNDMTSVIMQTEGESEKKQDVKRIEVRKAKVPLRVVTG